MTYVLISAAVLVVAIATFWVVNRPQLILIEAQIPDDFPVGSFSHETFELLLKEYVDADGRVDYERWHQSNENRGRLDSYLAAVSAYSPTNSPERFSKKSDELAYWLYAYNAYVVRSVLSHWPLDSVTRLRAPVEVVKGFGFFWRQRFLFGGDAKSLYAVENRVIRTTYRDPRIHFVLNCASESCPVLRPELPTGDDLESLLAIATIDFVSDEKNVRIDHSNHRIILSDIFKWYEKDFVNDLRRRGLPSERGLIEYLITVAPEAMAAELRAAKDFGVEFDDYDWTINNSDR